MRRNKGGQMKMTGHGKEEGVRFGLGGWDDE